MPFIYLLLLALVHLRPDWPEPPFGMTTGDAAFIQIAGSMIFVFLAMGLAHWFCVLLQRDPEQRLPLLRDFQTWKGRHSKAFLVFFLLSSYQLGWGWSVQDLYTQAPQPAPALPGEAGQEAPEREPSALPRERASMPGFEALFLSPFLLGLVGSWLFFYRFEKLTYDMSPLRDEAPFVGRGAYILHLVRQHFMLLALPLLMMLGAEILTHFVAVPESVTLSTAWVGVSVGTVLLFLTLVPWLLRLFLGLRPLPEGPLRARLAETGRVIKLRFSDILLWETRNSMANAMVTGVVPWLRYVVVTDRLLNELHEEEVQAVFGHEAGHIRHHHMAFYIVFLVTSVTLLPYVWDGLFAGLALAWPRTEFALRELRNSTELKLIAGVLYIFLAFGFLSRRCERQADLFGARVSSPTAFIFALEKVAYANGIPRENPGWFSSWQHSTIARRVDFIERTIEDPNLAPAFQRRFSILKWALTLALLAGTAFVVFADGWGMPTP